MELHHLPARVSPLREVVFLRTLSGQPKHARDIAAILKAKKGQLDYGYIESWVVRLGLISVWQEIRAGSN